MEIFFNDLLLINKNKEINELKKQSTKEISKNKKLNTETDNLFWKMKMKVKNKKK